MTPTVSMPLTYALLHDRADSLLRNVGQVRPVPDSLDALRFLVRDCLRLPLDCRALATEVQRQAFDEMFALKPGSSFDATRLLEKRRLAEQVFDSLSAVIEACIKFTEDPIVAAKLSGEARSLGDALAEVRQTRLDFSENFPLLNELEAAAARAETLTGTGLELDDAFAEIAGCSKEEWLARVSVHEQAKRTA